MTWQKYQSRIIHSHGSLGLHLPDLEMSQTSALDITELLKSMGETGGGEKNSECLRKKGFKLRFAFRQVLNKDYLRF